MKWSSSVDCILLWFWQWEKLLIWFMLWKNNIFCRNVQNKLQFCLCCNMTAKLRVQIAAFFFFLSSTQNRCQAVFPQVPILQKSLYLPRQLLLLKISIFQQKRPILGYFSFVWRRRQVFSLTFLTNQMCTDVFTSRSNKGALLQIKCMSVSPSQAYIYNCWSACCIHRKMYGTNGEGQYITIKS